jgi:hypothetical protein
MNEIEIKDVQNVAQNMIVGSKQHTLFNSVTSNNPNLVTTAPASTPEYGEIDPAGERGLEISKISVSTPDGQSLSAVAVTGTGTPGPKPGCCSNGGESVGMGENLTGGIEAPKGLNSQLYGMLKPCSKQFNAAPVAPAAPAKSENEGGNDEGNSEY